MSVRAVLPLLALFAAACRSKATQERERIADSVIAAEQVDVPNAEPAVQWERAEEVPHLRLDGATAVIGDTVYLLGGVGPGDTLSAISTVDIFDPVTRRWSTGPALPSALSHIQAAVVGDSTIWIAGGFLGKHGGPPTAGTWRLDRRLGQWVAGPSLPEARGGGALVALGDTLYYAGGWGADRSTDRGEVWQLLPRATAWRPRAAMPVARGDAAAVGRDGRVLLFGGQQSHDVTPVDLADAWAYDPRADRWTALPAMPATRSHATAAVVQWGDWVLIPGGGDIAAGRRFSPDMLGYHVQRNVWRRLPELPLRLRGGNGWLRGDTLQLAGGAEVNNAPSNRFRWGRTLRGIWMPLPGQGPTTREERIAVAGDELVVLGSRSRSTWHYHLPTGRWGAEDDWPYRPRQGDIVAVVSDGERLDLLGGTALGDSIVILQSFDVARRSWSVGPAVPDRVRGPMLVSAAGSTWLIGSPFWRRRQEPRELAAGVVYRLGAGGVWDSVAVVPEPRVRARVAGDAQRICILGGDDPIGNWTRGIQCMEVASTKWRSTLNGDFDSIPEYIGLPRDAAAVNGRYFLYARAGYAFDPARNAWDAVPQPPIEVRLGSVVTDGDRLLHYSPRTGKVWMMWP
ncbi:MAG: hypothetical protein KA267_08270 [Gemmatimonadales bacterium]|nr:hypothetical protein [Gemmatimonadales bacterium]MBP7620330.1 hypothetical protein [Gemmatimonadales bacterium]